MRRRNRPGRSSLCDPVGDEWQWLCAPKALFLPSWKSHQSAGVKRAEFTANGIIGAFLPGMLFPWSGTAAPNANWLLPFGQTVNRITYADLWAFAQIEIAAGNTFYNNGDGFTTFGVGDLRGRVWGAVDNMGGSDASRLSNAASSIATTRTTVGGTGGLVVVTLTSAQIPAHSHPNTLTDPGHLHTYTDSSGGQHGSSGVPGGVISGTTNTSSSTTGITITNANNTGGGGAHDNVQPTMLGQFILFAGGQ